MCILVYMCADGTAPHLCLEKNNRALNSFEKNNCVLKIIEKKLSSDSMEKKLGSGCRHTNATGEKTRM